MRSGSGTDVYTTRPEATASRPNHVLAEMVTVPLPGDALDLECGA